MWGPEDEERNISTMRNRGNRGKEKTKGREEEVQREERGEESGKRGVGRS